MASGRRFCISTGRNWLASIEADSAALTSVQFLDSESTQLCACGANYNQNCVKLSLFYRPLMAVFAVGTALHLPAQQVPAAASQTAAHGI